MSKKEGKNQTKDAVRKTAQHHQSNEKHLTTLLEEKGREEAEREEDEKKKRWARGRTKETQILIVACE